MALRESVGELASTFLSIIRTRLELFSVEASGESSRLIRLLCMALFALVSLILAVLVLSLTIALYFWPTEHRFLALGLVVAFYLVCAVGLFWAVRHSIKTAAAPFSATIDELRRDIGMANRLREPARSDRS